MCLGVVLVHANSTLRPAIKDWWPAGIITAPLFSVLVPAFFIISGYFASGRPGGERDRASGPFLLRRIKRLFVPLVSWNLVMFLAGGGLARRFTWQSLFELITGFWHLYFLFVLLQLLVLNRLVLGAVPPSRKIRSWLAVTGALSLGYYAAANLTLWIRGIPSVVFETHLDTLFLPWSVFFVLGLWLRHEPGGWELLARRLRWVAALAALSYATFVLELRLEDARLGAEPLGQFLFSGSFFQTSLSLLLLAGLGRWRRRAGPKFSRGILHRLSGDTYGIFLAHGVVLISLVGLYDRAGVPVPPAFEVPLLWAGTWFLSLGIVRAIRSAPVPILRAVLLGEIASRAVPAAASSPENT